MPFFHGFRKRDVLLQGYIFVSMQGVDIRLLSNSIQFSSGVIAVFGYLELEVLILSSTIRFEADGWEVLILSRNLSTPKQLEGIGIAAILVTARTSCHCERYAWYGIWCTLVWWSQWLLARVLSRMRFPQRAQLSRIKAIEERCQSNKWQPCSKIPLMAGFTNGVNLGLRLKGTEEEQP